MGLTDAFSLNIIPALRYGAVAQLGERLVRNEKASGSIPLSSTKFLKENNALSFAG